MGPIPAMGTNKLEAVCVKKLNSCKWSLILESPSGCLVVSGRELSMKSNRRSVRRHHASRLKLNRRFHWGRDLSRNPKVWGKVVNTPATCSCWMCGNPRKYNGELTVQELKHIESAEADWDVG